VSHAFLHAKRRTDTHDEAISPFRDCDLAKK